MRLPVVEKGNPAHRRNVPIAAYVGPNGSGKSFALVADTLPALDAGRKVLSTVRLLDFRNPRECEDLSCSDPSHGLEGHMAAHPGWVPLDDYRLLLSDECRNADVLLDEVTGVADSREFASMPVQVRNLLVQLRRRDVILRWSSPAWAFADVTIRRVTQAVTVCSGYLAQERPGSMWRDRRLFWLRTYDARDLDEFDSGKRADIGSHIRELLWRDRSLARHAYSTMDRVLTLGATNDAGICLECGGKRTHPRCSCKPAAVDQADDVDSARGPRRGAGRRDDVGGPVRLLAGAAVDLRHLPPPEPTADLPVQLRSTAPNRRRRHG